jgi:hypothetical protein
LIGKFWEEIIAFIPRRNNIDAFLEAIPTPSTLYVGSRYVLGSFPLIRDHFSHLHAEMMAEADFLLQWDYRVNFSGEGRCSVWEEKF